MNRRRRMKPPLPDCGGTDAIDIAATVCVRLGPAASDVMLSHKGHHAPRKDSGENSAVRCTARNFRGQLRHLHQNAREQPA